MFHNKNREKKQDAWSITSNPNNKDMSKFPKQTNLKLTPSKALSFHSPLKNPPIDEFPIDLTLENFYHPTANSLRPVRNL